MAETNTSFGRISLKPGAELQSLLLAVTTHGQIGLKSCKRLKCEGPKNFYDSYVRDAFYIML